MFKNKLILSVSNLLILCSCNQDITEYKKMSPLKHESIIESSDSLFFQGQILNVFAKDSLDKDTIHYTEIIAILHEANNYSNKKTYRVLDNTTNWECLLTRLKCDSSISFKSAVFENIRTVNKSDILKVPANSFYNDKLLPTIIARVSLISTNDFGFNTNNCRCN